MPLACSAYADLSILEVEQLRRIALRAARIRRVSSNSSPIRLRHLSTNPSPRPQILRPSFLYPPIPGTSLIVMLTDTDSVSLRKSLLLYDYHSGSQVGDPLDMSMGTAGPGSGLVEGPGICSFALWIRHSVYLCTLFLICVHHPTDSQPASMELKRHFHLPPKLTSFPFPLPRQFSVSFNSDVLATLAIDKKRRPVIVIFSLTSESPTKHWIINTDLFNSEHISAACIAFAGEYFLLFAATRDEYRVYRTETSFFTSLQRTSLPITLTLSQMFTFPRRESNPGDYLFISPSPSFFGQVRFQLEEMSAIERSSTSVTLLNPSTGKFSDIRHRFSCQSWGSASLTTFLFEHSDTPAGFWLLHYDHGQGVVSCHDLQMPYGRWYHDELRELFDSSVIRSFPQAAVNEGTGEILLMNMRDDSQTILCLSYI